MYGNFKILMELKLNCKFGILLGKKNIKPLHKIIIRIVMEPLFPLVLILEIRFIQYVNNMINNR